MDHDQQLRNLRDFLLVYNRMTEICFMRCTSNLNYRNLTVDEEHCVDSCAGKLIRSNHRLMGTYVQLMPRIMQKRLDEMESKASKAGVGGESGGATAESAPVGALPEVSPISGGAQSSATLAASLSSDAASGGSGAPLAAPQEPATAAGVSMSTVTEMVPPGVVRATTREPVPPSVAGKSNIPASGLGPSTQMGQQPLTPPLLKTIG